mgnify:CR=1 FL=1
MMKIPISGSKDDCQQGDATASHNAVAFLVLEDETLSTKASITLTDDSGQPLRKFWVDYRNILGADLSPGPAATFVEEKI